MADLIAEIRASEEMLLAPDDRQTPAQLANLLADDFLEIGASGSVYDKVSVIQGLSEDVFVRFEISEFRTQALGQSHALATYVLTKTDASGRKERSRRSSIWKSVSGGWRLLFHQGTVLAE